MRASRLIMLLFTLQRRRAATAGELARELEVSERTVYRDVAALLEVGVPIYTEPGRGGGIRLLDGWRTRLDGLTGPEAAALFAGPAPQALTDLGLTGAFAGAQTKLLGTLSPQLREHAAAMAERFHLDAPGWFDARRPVPHLAAVATAVWDQQRLRVRYRRGAGTGAAPGPEVERILEPLGLVLKAGTWYVAAVTGQVAGARVDGGPADVEQPIGGEGPTEGSRPTEVERPARGGRSPGEDESYGVTTSSTVDGRGVVGASGADGRSRSAVATFRVDRITATAPTGEWFARPADFDLAQWWADAAGRFAERMLRETVRLRLSPRGLRALRMVTDQDAALRATTHAGPPDAAGWRAVELDVESQQVATSQLIGLGGDVEVLAPGSLRSALAAAGAALAARNHGPAPQTDLHL